MCHNEYLLFILFRNINFFLKIKVLILTLANKHFQFKKLPEFSAIQ